MKGVCHLAENYEYEPILKEMLSIVPDTLDKREGSVIYNTLAPAAYLLARQNYMLGYLFDLLFADTATGAWLDRVVYDFGVDRENATYALRQINTYDSDSQPLDIPLASRFAINDVTFALTEKIADGQYKAECEQAGTQGNLYSGTILPVDNINGLGSAELVAEPLVPARDTEEDEVLRERFYRSVRQSPYGGNIADYEEKTLSIEGVGAVRVFNAVSMGPGNVGLIIGDEQQNKATQELIDRVQEVMGVDGNGIAPIYHTVTVSTSTDKTIDVTAPIRLKTGASLNIVKPVVEQAVRDYIGSIDFNDETVFWAKLVSEILNCHESIIDVGNVLINGTANNIALTKLFENFEVPVVGTITVTEVS